MTCTVCNQQFETSESIGYGCRLCQLCWEEESARAWWESVTQIDELELSDESSI